MTISRTPQHPITPRPAGGVSSTTKPGATRTGAKVSDAAKEVAPPRSPSADPAHQAKATQALAQTGSGTGASEVARQAHAGPMQNGGGGGGAGLLRFALASAPLTSTTPAAGAKGPPSLAVQGFMTDYGIDQRMGRPRERLLERMAEVHTQFASFSSADEVATHLEAGLVRFSVFKLEGALKLYRKEYGAPIEEQYDAVKALEDKAGEVARFSDRLELAQDAGLPPPAIKVLQSKLDAARVEVRKEIDGQWVPDAQGQIPALAHMAETLGGMEWAGYNKDRDGLLKELKRRATKATKGFDVDQLQGETGLHELRRQLRWALLYCGAVDGLVKLDPKDHPIPDFAPLLDDPIASTKYAVLPSSAHEDDPLLVSQSVFLALNRYVIDIGDIKDVRERVEDFAHALFESGACRTLSSAEGLAAKHVFKHPGETAALDAQINNILGELAKHRPLEAFLDAF